MIEGLGLSVTSAAAALGISRPAFSNLLNEHAHLSAEMALRIEKAFGVSMDELMLLQTAFDIAETRKRARHIQVAPFRVHVLSPVSAPAMQRAST